MRKFYESLLDQQQTKVGALREAQRYMRRVTMRDTIEYVVGVRGRPQLDAALVPYLDLIIAETRLAARDYAAALNEFQDLGTRAGLDADVKRRIEGGAWRATVGLHSGGHADYDRPLYDDPYYWAPFIIVGDWK
jgi:CHAT domain-containing protein